MDNIWQGVINFLGPAGIPAVSATATLAVAELAERLASKEAKHALTYRLRTLDVGKAAILPQGTKEIFDRIFGQDQWSLNCFRRSLYFSVAAIAFMILIYTLVHWDNMHLAFRPKNPENQKLFNMIVVTWIPFSVLLDYLNLFKTRVILTILTREMRYKIMLGVATLVLDLLIGYVIFALLFSLIGLLIEIVLYHEKIAETLRDVSNWPRQDLDLLIPVLQLKIPTAALFYAGMLPSIWLWIFVVAMFITRMLVRSQPVVRSLLWLLNIDEKPFRSAGAVAAALVFAVLALLGAARAIAT